MKFFWCKYVIFLPGGIKVTKYNQWKYCQLAGLIYLYYYNDVTKALWLNWLISKLYLELNCAFRLLQALGLLCSRFFSVNSYALAHRDQLVQFDLYKRTLEYWRLLIVILPSIRTNFTFIFHGSPLSLLLVWMVRTTLQKSYRTIGVTCITLLVQLISPTLSCS